MSSEVLKIGYQPHVLDYRWVINLRQACTKDKDTPLDWYRMAAIAILLSNGDPQLRIIDWDFLEENLGPDNPIVLPDYDENERPNIEVIDMATRWGLFQIRGDEARDFGYSGSTIGLCSVDANIKIACQKLYFYINKIEERINKIELEGGDINEANELMDALPGLAEKMAFNVEPYHVQEIANNFQRRLQEEAKAFETLYE